MPTRFRNVLISIFVIIWTLVFHYESLRGYWLEPMMGRSLPKVKFLFPPAGWIMFYAVDGEFGYAEVYGIKDGEPQLLDPHQIIPTRFIGFDNIHRGVLGTILEPRQQRPFCEYLQRKFPYFDNFIISATHHPSLTTTPHKQVRNIFYDCR